MNSLSTIRKKDLDKVVEHVTVNGNITGTNLLTTWEKIKLLAWYFCSKIWRR